MTGKTSVRDRRDCEQAVMAAARDERAAHADLRKGIKPLDPGWTEQDKDAYDARLARWRSASRALVDALNRAADETFSRSPSRPSAS
jgi:uncharacterized protein YukE